MRELILIRGLPGSGKSTLAKSIRWVTAEPIHLEADMYFHPLISGLQGPVAADEYDLYSPDNRDVWVYNFVPSQIPNAHAWCQNAARYWLKTGRSIVVSNTFTRMFEMKPYIDMAREFDAQLTVIKCEGQYGNIHNVPDGVIQKMKDRWEEYNG